MPLELIRQDITQMQTDAIVNAANSRLQRGGGVCGAIFSHADGQKLQAACDAIGYCAPGDAVLTPSFGLPARYVIHAVGPVWKDGLHGEAETLASCYTRSLTLAREHGLSSIAFPLISSGIFGFPPRKALSVAISAISDWLMASDGDMLVYLILYDHASFAAGSALRDRIQSFIDDRYIGESPRRRASEEVSRQLQAEAEFLADFAESESECIQPPPCATAPEFSPRSSRSRSKSPVPPACAPTAPRRLEDVLAQAGESFSQMLFRLIDERNMTDPEVYKRANLDRKLFSKIRSHPDYQPGKATVLALAVALCLNPDQSQDLLRRAGFAFSPSSKSDLIIEFCLQEGIHNIHRVNELLFSFGEKTLGAQ